MASTPVAGMPKGSFGKPRANQGIHIEFYGIDEMQQALVQTLALMPVAMKACLTELGLFGEKETKERTPVQYGVLRASIGHFEPSLIKAPDPNDPKAEKPSAENAVFDVETQGDTYSVTWGTNVEYAPWIEAGFTHPGGFNVYIPGVGWRRTRAFSYRGAHMFELGLDVTSKAAPKIIEHWAGQAMAGGGMIAKPPAAPPMGPLRSGSDLVKADFARRSAAAKKGWQKRRGGS